MSAQRHLIVVNAPSYDDMSVKVFMMICLLKCLEAVAQTSSAKMLFLEISQNSQENTCARVPILIKLQASGLQLY